MRSPSDRVLIDLWKTGDDRAAAVLVERHAAALKRMARTLGAQNDADDLVQDVFVKGFAALDSFCGHKAGFRTWLVAILRRLIIDRWRAAQRDIARFIPLSDEMSVLLPSREQNALDRLIVCETRDRVLALLSPENRKLVQMRMAGHRWRSIARVFAVDEGAAKNRYHRLRKMLRKAAA